MNTASAPANALRERMTLRVEQIGGSVAPASAVRWARRVAVAEFAPSVAIEIDAAVQDAAVQGSAVQDAGPDATGSGGALSRGARSSGAGSSAPSPSPFPVPRDATGRIALLIGFDAPLPLLAALFGLLPLATAIAATTGLLLVSLVVLSATGGRLNPQVPAAPGAISANTVYALGALTLLPFTVSIVSVFASPDSGGIALICGLAQALCSAGLVALASVIGRKPAAPALPRADRPQPRSTEEPAVLAAIRGAVELTLLPTLPSELRGALRDAELETIDILRQRGDIGAGRAATAAADIDAFWRLGV